MAKRRTYFKHYVGAMTGDSIQRLIEGRHYRAVCLYWHLLEQLKANGTDGKVVLPLKGTARLLGTTVEGIQNDLRTISEHIEALCWDFVRTSCRVRGGFVPGSFWVCVSNFSKSQERDPYIREEKIREDKEKNRFSPNETPKPPPLVEKTGESQQGQAPPGHDPVPEILEYLNRKAGTRFRATTEANRRGISARLADGFTVEDCKRVIDVKCAEWLTDSEMRKYLNPETLFRPSKFEKYLNQLPAKDPVEEMLDVLESAPAIVRPERPDEHVRST